MLVLVTAWLHETFASPLPTPSTLPGDIADLDKVNKNQIRSPNKTRSLPQILLVAFIMAVISSGIRTNPSFPYRIIKKWKIYKAILIQGLITLESLKSGGGRSLPELHVEPLGYRSGARDNFISECVNPERC